MNVILAAGGTGGHMVPAHALAAELKRRGHGVGLVTDARGAKIPALFARHGIEPADVRLFPVTVARLGAPSADVWAWRREAVNQAIKKAPDESIRRMGQDYLKLLEKYAEESSAYYSTARLWDDGVIDPADTRRILGLCIAASLNAPFPQRTHSVFRM